ncbi:MAG: hypothetical protein KJO55_00620 [Gammaproteobacteria bacterium]|nr:hypothetical protein [Gammaproteobacteria bacterium]
MGRLSNQFVILWLLLLQTAAAQGDLPAPLFASDAILEVKLIAPLKQLARARGEPQYLPATMILDDGIELSLRVRPRGKSRRRSEVCHFPPLRLNFDKSVAGTVFATQNRVKLVTHCRNAESFQQYILREYVIYRIYNRLTDYSFRVRLLRITYEDSDKPGRPVTRLGFLIEDKHALAQRLGGEVAEPESIPPSAVDATHSPLFDQFQYLVGNTDWAALRGPEGENCCHNVVLLTHDNQTYIPIPYDFDNSGLVDAPYAAPSSQLGIDEVTERLYRGMCRDEATTSAAIDQVVQARAGITEFINSFALLTSRTRSKLQRYLGRYYDIAADPKRRAREIDSKCRYRNQSTSRRVIRG